MIELKFVNIGKGITVYNTNRIHKNEYVTLAIIDIDRSIKYSTYIDGKIACMIAIYALTEDPRVNYSKDSDFVFTDRPTLDKKNLPAIVF